MDVSSSPGRDPRNAEPGRAAQRRRTRAAIVGATTGLIADGRTPSVDEIAAAADVSRRTVYMYFPTLDQLLLDATVGALSTSAFAAPPSLPDSSSDPAVRVDDLVRALTRTASSTLPLGRKIIALTVDAAPDGPDTTRRPTDDPRRGFRRLDWIRQAVEPMRAGLTGEQFDRLVSGLSIVIGWEAMVVLRDVNGLSPRREDRVLRWVANALVEAMRSEAAQAEPTPTKAAPKAAPSGPTRRPRPSA